MRYRNRYGIEIAGDLYAPENAAGKLPALAVSGPFGAVKEQSSGLYANELARRGFIAVAFDPSFTGESGGQVRDVASPDIFTEDFSATVDFLGLQENVDRDRIGLQAICGLSGMAITAATSDSRIKAVATASMYDMSRSISCSHEDSYTPENRRTVIDYYSQQRWTDAENGSYARGFHEVPLDADGEVVTGDRILPETLPEGADAVTSSFFDYYRTERGYHPRSINSNTAWTATTPASFFAFPLMARLDEIIAPVLMISGDQAHSLYYSQDVHGEAPGKTELVVVPGADHVDLYDKKDLIPFDQIEQFFRKSFG
ncbi:alpha/beta hydrolase [Nesterenkonia sp. CL21]|uniref:alpha/beta hydrolase n=1 Tax=Nesterenkonia sp. CL21 TaxID=3064894 RepID=UPI002879B4D0|nr:alpha/beta hydrolase [Nesterenkonia sp. CL21]MDS2171846.1 alpha/beta hydrolase [Nesterenkonia sp. CL21]